MRRICLLLAFLLSLQLFAGMHAPAPTGHLQQALATQFETVSSVSSDSAHMLWPTDGAAALSVADAAEAEQDGNESSTQGEVDELAMPTPLTRLALDWQPFSHHSPDVVDGISVFVDVMLPPPLAAA